MLKQHELSFEDALAELEALVDTLEQEDLPLDESIMRFGNGLVTARAAHGMAQTQAVRYNTIDTGCCFNTKNKLPHQNE